MAALLLAAAAAPFWAGRFLPFLDLPQHLGLATVVARVAEPGSSLARYYQLDLRVTPYWGYYAAMWLLGRAFPIELANRLLFTAYAVGLPLSAAFLLTSFRRDWRWAVLTVPLVFNTNLFFGFATFVLAIPLAVLALGLAERELAWPRRRGRAVALGAVVTLVFLAHVQAYLVLGAGVLLLLLVHGRGPRAWARAAVPYLPSLALFGAWFVPSFLAPHARELGHTPHYRPYGGLGGLGAKYEPWDVVVRAMPERVLGAFGDGSDRWIGAGVLLLFLIGWLTGGGSAADGSPSPPSARLARAVPALLVVTLLSTYLLVPMEISGAWYTNARHLVFAAVALPLLLRRPATGWRAGLAALGAALSLLACANAAAQVRAFQRQVGPFEEIARRLPPGGRVLGLPFDLGAGGPVRTWPFLHWACWQQILAGGDVGFSFAGLPSIPVRYRPGMQAPHPYEWRPWDFDWAAMGPHYDAFLVSGTPRGRGGAELRAHAEVVAAAGPFTLWKPRGGSTRLPPP